MTYKKFTKIILINIFVIFSTHALCLESKKIESESVQRILETYGKNNLSSKPPFQGGYINFGYWKNIPFNQNGQVITKEERVKASFDLYKLIIDHLDVKQNESILEVGCGLGYGCRYVADNYNSIHLTCVDITPEQIERAKSIHQEVIKNNFLKFEVASADNISRPSNSYDKIYSVEAAQYFLSMSKFSNEAFRLLKPNGLLVLTAHFSTGEKGYKAAKDLLPTVAQSIDRMIPIDEVRDALRKAGFKEIKAESIGQYVFKGFDQWISQISDESWAHNIYQLYLNGHIDYYVLVFQKI